MSYDLIKISQLPLVTPDAGQDIVVGVGDIAKRINYGAVKADMVGISPTYTTDNEPYLMRQTANIGVVGKCALSKLVGGSLGWNQLCNGSSVTVPSGHKYYMKKSGTASIGASTGSALTGLTSGTDMVIDLTITFGSTIADYIYGLGSTDGVAWLSKYIDLGTYHAYDAGSIQSVEVTAHVTKDADDNVIGNYPLGSDTLRGIPQLVSNKLQFDGDEKYPDGTIRRRYGIVDLGSLNWNIGGTGTYRRFYTSETNLAKAPSTQGDDVNIICDSYVASAFNTLLTTDKRISINTTGAINISDSAYASSTGAQFKAAMAGKYLVYEKATESTESSTSYQKIQTIDADGTESFTTSSPVPVGHETATPDNILAALEWLGE